MTILISYRPKRETGMLNEIIDQLTKAATSEDEEYLSDAISHLAAFRQGNTSLIIRDDIDEIIENLTSTDK